MNNLESLAADVRVWLNAPDDDNKEALLLSALTRFFQAWDRDQVAATGLIERPNRDA